MPRLKNYQETTWTPEIDRALANLQITEASRQFGISARAIRKRRRFLGLSVEAREKAIRWTKKCDRLLGTMPDSEVAEQLGTSRFLARQRRIELVIAAFVAPPTPATQIDRRPPHHWTAKEERLLGTQPDPVIAERLDLCASVVTWRRHSLGIEPFQPGGPIEWTKGMLNLLGEVPDAHLAAEYEISHSVVKFRRIEEGILPYGKEFMDPEPDLPRHVISQIGKTPDKTLSDKFGVLRSHIRLYRALHGIPKAEYRPPRLHRWTKQDEALLGTKSDGRIAIELNITRDQVRLRRTELGIPPFGVDTSFRWSAKRIAELGKFPDGTLARRWNYSQVAVRLKREELGIAKCKTTKTHLTPQQIAQLGQAPDTVLAKQWGVSATFVRNHRNELGIPPRRSSKKFPWTAARIAKLGTMPDEELALQLNVSFQLVAAKRNELGIAVKRRPQKIDWSDPQIAAQLGTMSDGQLARQLGVTGNAIREQRLKRNIPAFQPDG